MLSIHKSIFFGFYFLLFISCSSEDDVMYEPLVPETNEAFSGGDATVFDISKNAFGFQAPNLTNDEQLNFFVGNSLFNLNWVTSPASTTARDGLGPLFNARSCSGCHFKDGRGRAPLFNGEFSHGLLLRLSMGENANGAPIGDANYKGQLQDQSIPTVTTEGGFSVAYTTVTGKYSDGTAYELRKPVYSLNDLSLGAPNGNLKISPRVANQMSGLGLLEAISEATLKSFVDENDINSDGISGRLNYVWDVQTNQLEIGKFGWKANQPNVHQQVAGAFNGDMGITSSLFPDENCPPNIDCSALPNGGNPEIDDDDLLKVVLYSSTLAVPARRNWKDQEVLEGKRLFNEANCIACHIPKITTGVHPTITALSNQTIRPYTDLLLHDMGEDLSDNRPDFLAQGNEWRTQPLWGIGLIETVNEHTNLLHDGRARTIEEAILWHGGEAQKSKENFTKLNAEQRAKLIGFIKTL